VALYHLGNNALHAAIYRRALERPGVVVLHDAVLHHFYLGQLDEAAYTKSSCTTTANGTAGWAANCGAAAPPPASDPRYFDFPMLRRAVERALAVVVHNPAAAEMVRRHAPGVRVVEIPHLFVPPELPARRRRCASGRSWACRPARSCSAFSATCGNPSACCRCSTRSPRWRASSASHAAGGRRFRLERSGTRRRAASVAPAVRRLPYLPGADFWLAASAVDACINLRYPAAGETSGIAIRLMGIGKPVLVTDSPECSRFPEDAVVAWRPAWASADRCASTSFC
jgi:hypothetical protein